MFKKETLFLIFSFTLILFGCNEFYSKSESDKKLELSVGKPISLKNLSLKGGFYEGVELKKRLALIVNNSDLGAAYKGLLFEKTNYNYNGEEPEIRTQYPWCFFTDLNGDNLEDLIFQTNGNLFNDIETVIVFISENGSKYRTNLENGFIEDVQIVQEYAYFSDRNKTKHLQLTLFVNRCCDNPWNKRITGLIDVNNPSVFEITSLQAFNVAHAHSKDK